MQTQLFPSLLQHGLLLPNPRKIHLSKKMLPEFYPIEPLGLHQPLQPRQHLSHKRLELTSDRRVLYRYQSKIIKEFKHRQPLHKFFDQYRNLLQKQRIYLGCYQC